MAFAPDEIEDGTGKPAAIVYGRTSDPVAEAIAYLVRRGKTQLANLTGTTNSVPKQEISLLRGTDYVEGIARTIVQGTVRVWDQSMVFPRYGVLEAGSNVLFIPWQVSFPEDYLRACWEASELHAAGDPLGDVVEDGGNVKKERLGGGATNGMETEYFFPGKTKIRVYPSIMGLLQPFLKRFGELPRA